MRGQLLLFCADITFTAAPISVRTTFLDPGTWVQRLGWRAQVRSSTGFTAVTTSGPFPLLAGRQGLGLAPPTLAQGDTVSLFF